MIYFDAESIPCTIDSGSSENRVYRGNLQKVFYQNTRLMKKTSTPVTIPFSYSFSTPYTAPFFDFGLRHKPVPNSGLHHHILQLEIQAIHRRTIRSHCYLELPHLIWPVQLPLPCPHWERQHLAERVQS